MLTSQMFAREKWREANADTLCIRIRDTLIRTLCPDASQGEFNRVLIYNASELYFLVELLVCCLCAVSYVVASICGHKNTVTEVVSQ